jgi:hypothetical protein
MTPLFEINHKRLMTMATMLLITLGIVVAIFMFIAWYPFVPAKFYKPVILTPVVHRGDIFTYDIILDKYTKIAPTIQRSLVCGKDENIIILENAIGTSKIGDKRIRRISVEIPRSSPVNKLCRVGTHIEYPYFGGLRKIPYDIWTDYFEVLEENPDIMAKKIEAEKVIVTELLKAATIEAQKVLADKIREGK